LTANTDDFRDASIDKVLQKLVQCMVRVAPRKVSGPVIAF
jgi:UDP-glucose 6-dehydrogenase